MPEQNTPVVPQQEPKMSSVPVPLEPSLLRHVGGGLGAPHGGELW